MKHFFLHFTFLLACFCVGELVDTTFHCARPFSTVRYQPPVILRGELTICSGYSVSLFAHHRVALTIFFVTLIAQFRTLLFTVRTFSVKIIFLWSIRHLRSYSHYLHLPDTNITHRFFQLSFSFPSFPPFLFPFTGQISSIHASFFPKTTPPSSSALSQAPPPLSPVHALPRGSTRRIGYRFPTSVGIAITISTQSSNSQKNERYRRL